jgi:hypothetical protein
MTWGQIVIESVAGMEPFGDLDLEDLHRPIRASKVRELTA